MDMILQTDEGVKFSEIGLAICEILGFRGRVVEVIALLGF